MIPNQAFNLCGSNSVAICFLALSSDFISLILVIGQKLHILYNSHPASIPGWGY